MAVDQTRGEIRTDLAMETHQLLAGKSGLSVSGVESHTEEKGKTKITRVIIQTAEAGEALGKKPGYYVSWKKSPRLLLKNCAPLSEDLTSATRPAP